MTSTSKTPRQASGPATVRQPSRAPEPRETGAPEAPRPSSRPAEPRQGGDPAAPRPKVLLIGLGGLTGVVLELLARDEAIGPIVVGSRNAARGAARCNLARMGAMAQGCAPSIRFVPLDLDRPEAAADVLRRESPDLIFSAATRQTWWLPEMLPPAAAAPIRRAGFGAWLPVHLTLSMKLMRAVRAAGCRGPVLTAPFPDVVNAILARLDLAPTCGVGNLDEIVPKVRLLAAERMGAPLEEVRVLLVAHHALEPLAFRDPGGTGGTIPPYFLRVIRGGDASPEAWGRGGEDVTEMVRASDLLLSPYPLPSGPAFCFLTGGSTVRLIRALLADRETLLHAPAPGGLPGGYPVIAGRGVVRPAPIAGLSLQEAIALNERSHRFDGIERIEADGTAVFRAEGVEAMDRALGYRCERLRPEEADDRAHELLARFREYAARHGVALQRLAGGASWSAV